MDAFFCHDESYLSRLDVYTYLQYAFQNTSRFGASKRRFVSLFLSCKVWRGGKGRGLPGIENLLKALDQKTCAKMCENLARWRKLRIETLVRKRFFLAYVALRRWSASTGDALAARLS